MKNLILSAFLLLFAWTAAQAQVEATVREENRSMSKGSFNCLILDLPGVSEKSADKGWKEVTKKLKGKSSKDKKSGELILDDAEIEGMSENSIDIYAKIVPTSNGVEFVAWFNLGVTYLSSAEYPDRYPAGEKLLMDLAKEVSLDMLEEELKTEEKNLNTMEKDLESLANDKEKREKDIEDYQKTIAEMEANIQQAEQDIQQNLEDQANKNTEIETQKGVIQDLEQRIESTKGK